jgi:hypothetical protein
MFAMRIRPRSLGCLATPVSGESFTGSSTAPSQPQRERGIGGSAIGSVHSTGRFFSIRVGGKAARPISGRPADRWLRW